MTGRMASRHRLCNHGRMRILFLGSGQLACPALQALADSGRHTLVAVVTQPDRPRGRRLQMEACPGNVWATTQGVPVFTPEKIGEANVVDELCALNPDILVVAAYGQFLRKNLLSAAPLGAVNIHPSLLPRYRGAAPIQWAIARGEIMTGVTILYVTERMDAGDILMQESAPILPEDTATSLEPRLATLGAALLLRTLEDVTAGTTRPAPQDESLATFAPKLTKEDGRMDWTRSATDLYNRLRGFQPWPGAFTTLRCGDESIRMKILRAEVTAAQGPAGGILSISENGLIVAAGRDALRLMDVQPEGRATMPAGAFCRGRRTMAGASFS